ncbi:hypothetical protein GIB67_031472 [Kingdonia uniflora]|uniref:F-box/LRR-repeat protein 15/At3g58940/PEG3-like LRR domain-containing protein n=1 Tax=Kingdonia uniflora TaxID=39325 RepID=A0A7J7MNA2_9MAGN|nr:hypothetical protein GIB67_031472 [Kingdonia uniflora]
MGVFCDYISNLPDNVIERILLEFPMKDGAKTSVLSTKWRYKWAAVPQLKFYDSIDEIPANYSIVNIIDHVLLLHIGPIHKFELSHTCVNNMLSFRDMDRWIFVLSKYEIKKFILESWHETIYTLPYQLFSYQYLNYLKLRNCIFVPPPTFKGFPHLHTLDLQHVTISDDALESLVSNSPLLENLFLEFFNCSNLRINAPNLRNFYFDGIYNDIVLKNTVLLSTVGIYLESLIKDDKSERLTDFICSLLRIKELRMDTNLLKYSVQFDVDPPFYIHAMGFTMPPKNKKAQQEVIGDPSQDTPKQANKLNGEMLYTFLALCKRELETTKDVASGLSKDSWTKIREE